jgi:hypothetical protein
MFLSQGYVFLVLTLRRVSQPLLARTSWQCWGVFRCDVRGLIGEFTGESNHRHNIAGSEIVGSHPDSLYTYYVENTSQKQLNNNRKKEIEEIF